MQLYIRKLKSLDIPRVKEIENRSFPKTPYDTLTFIAYWISYPDSFLVYDDGKVKGYIIFDPYDGHIISIAVDFRYRRMGIGSKLVDEVLKSIGRAFVEVRISNKEAIQFYRKMGFSQIGSIPNYYVTEDAIIMIKVEAEHSSAK